MFGLHGLNDLFMFLLLVYAWVHEQISMSFHVYNYFKPMHLLSIDTMLSDIRVVLSGSLHYKSRSILAPWCWAIEFTVERHILRVVWHWIMTQYL